LSTTGRRGAGDVPASRSAYASAGVDVAAGEEAVERFRRRLRPASGDLLGGIGGFAAAMAVPAGMHEPVLVAATDGVGTKTEIARTLNRFDTIGRDLVAMCADDVVCHGARPAFFLDYVAVGRLSPERVAELVGGIADACDEIGCALVGGETAEHPGVMEPDAFDLAGFCVGIAEREQLLDGRAARADDVVLGLASSGLHANGFSLVRALMARHGMDLEAPYADVLAEHGLDDAAGADGQRLGDELLTPTRLYTVAALGMRDGLSQAGLRLAGLAHVTGGGLAANLPRAVAPALGVRIRAGSWPEPPIFGLVARVGQLDGAEMRATFNCGVGMAAIVEPAAVGPSIELLLSHGVPAWPIGEVVPAPDAGPERYLEET
jgi:phosphoribosylformylglycinamidine cyclo-ligase